MRIKLLIATCETDYAQHLSNHLSKHYADSIIVCMCRSQECLKAALKSQKFDVALFENGMFENEDISLVSLPLMLITEDKRQIVEEESKVIIKYQRISSIVAEIMAKCAKISKYIRGISAIRANITAVWSPAGGVGKTTVALSYAAKKVSEGKQVLYLNLESFSSVPAYFSETGRSISAVFEMLGDGEGNIKMLIRGICQQDSGVGVAYFCRPENFDDMYALSAENIAELTSVCASVTEELVIDMSCVCDWRARKVFEHADKILLVSDTTATAKVKLSQFLSQHNVFESIKEKVVFIGNKGALIAKQTSGTIINLPFVKASDPKAVYKTLSGSLDSVDMS